MPPRQLRVVQNGQLSGLEHAQQRSLPIIERITRPCKTLSILITNLFELGGDFSPVRGCMNHRCRNAALREPCSFERVMYLYTVAIGGGIKNEIVVGEQPKASL